MKISVIGERCTIVDGQVFVAGAKRVYPIEFIFDNSWDGYTATAVFESAGSEPVSQLLVDDKCIVPWEVLIPNVKFRVGVFGVKDNIERPTIWTHYLPVADGTEDAPEAQPDPTPGMYTQMLQLLNQHEQAEAIRVINEEARKAAEDVRQEAENERAAAEAQRVANDTRREQVWESQVLAAGDAAKDAEASVKRAEQAVAAAQERTAAAEELVRNAETTSNKVTSLIDSAYNAAARASEAEESTKQSQSAAATSASNAKSSEQSAQASEEHIQQMTEHPPIPGENGCWSLWDNGKYVESDIPLPVGLDGKDGYTPVKGVDYFDGKDGYTPVKGVDYFDGEPGKDGYTPVKGVDYFDGAPGKDGYTPVRGTDYWTDADKEEIIGEIKDGAVSWNDLTDKPFYSETGLIEPLLETSATMDDSGTSFGVEAIELEVGKTYTVKWNGVEYSCVGQLYAEDGTEVGVVLGNLGLMTGVGSTGEPFVFIAVNPSMIEAMGGFSWMVIALDGSTSATFSVSDGGEIVRKLDNKYLDLAWLPTVSSSESEFFAESTVKSGNSLKLDTTWVDSESQIVAEIDGLKLPPMRARVYADGFYFGNLAIVDASLANTGEPILLLCLGPSALVVGYPDAGEHSLRLSRVENIYNRMPYKFLPERLSTDLNCDKPQDTDVFLSSVASAIARGVRVECTRNPGQWGEVIHAKLGDAGNSTATWLDGTGLRLFSQSAQYATGSYDMSAAMFHTPAANTNIEGKVLRVRKMCPSGEIHFELVDPGEAMFLTSPSGKKFKLAVADDGTLSTTEAT